MRDRFLSEVGPDASGSKPGKEGWDHMPEKSGIDAAPWFDCSENAADENMAAVVAMITIRMIDSSIRRRPNQ
jgi:hypothetical protein